MHVLQPTLKDNSLMIDYLHHYVCIRSIIITSIAGLSLSRKIYCTDRIQFDNSSAKVI
jgi:hypothetical protein